MLHLRLGVGNSNGIADKESEREGGRGSERRERRREGERKRKRKESVFVVHNLLQQMMLSCTKLLCQEYLASCVKKVKGCILSAFPLPKLPERSRHTDLIYDKSGLHLEKVLEREMFCCDLVFDREM